MANYKSNRRKWSPEGYVSYEERQFRNGGAAKLNADIKSFYEEYNSLVDNDTNRNKGGFDIYRPDSSEWYDSVSGIDSSLQAKADDILKRVGYYKDFLGDDYYKSITKDIANIKSNSGIIKSNAQSSKDFYTQFTGEDSYKEWLTGYKEQQALLNYDLEAGRKEIEAMAKDIPSIPKTTADMELISQFNEKVKYFDMAANAQERQDIINSDYTPGSTLNFKGVYNKALLQGIQNRESNVAFQLMTDDEKKIYRTYWERGDYQKAEEFFKELEPRLNEGADAYAINRMAEIPVLRSVLSIPLSAGAGLENIINAGKYLTGATDELERSEFADASSALRQGATDWMGGGWLGKTGKFVYNTAMSGIDSVVSSALLGPTGAGVSLGLSAAASATNDALDRGMGSGKALLNGIFAGAFEGIFESVSLSQLDALKDAPVDSFKTYVKEIAKQMGVNASEEMATEAANILYDSIVNGQYSNYAQMRADGMSPGEAILSLGKDIGLAGASGALMGFGFGAVGGAIGADNYKSETAQIKSELEAAGYKGDIDTLSAALYKQEYAKRKDAQSLKLTDAESKALGDYKSFEKESRAHYELDGYLNVFKVGTHGMSEASSINIGKRDPASVAEAFNSLYVQGFKGNDISAANQRKAATLTENEQRIAYNAGKMDAIYQKEQKAKPEGAKIAQEPTEPETPKTDKGTPKQSSTAVNSTSDDLSSEISKIENARMRSYAKAFKLGREGVKTYGSTIRDGQNVGEFTEDFVRAYNAGKNGADLSKVKTLVMSDAQKNMAYNAGRMDAIKAEADNKKSRTRKFKSGESVVMADEASLTDEQKTIRANAKKLGINIIFGDVRTKNGKAANGLIDKETGDIYISTVSKKAIEFVTKHELTHYLENVKNVNQYYDLMNAVFDSETFKQWYTDKDFKSLAGMANKRIAEYAEGAIKLDELGAKKEILADFVGEMLFGGENQISDNLFAELEDKHKKTFREWISAVLERIRSIFAGDKKAVSEIDKLETMFREVLATRVEEGAKGEGGNVKLNFGKLDFATQVDAVLNGSDANSTHLKVMETPNLLQKAGLPNLPILMTAKHLKTITSANGKDKSNYHNLSVEIVKKLPQYISDPVMIANSLTRDDSVVIITEAMDSQKRPVIAAILLCGDGRINKTHVKANIMTSAYGKDNFQTFINNIADNNATIYWNEKKSKEMSVSLGLQLPNAITRLRSNVIIRQAKAFVNTSDEKTSKKSDVGLSYTPDDEQELTRMAREGEITAEEYGRRMLEIKESRSAEDLYSIARMSPEDMNTTPHLDRLNGEAKGDGESKFHGSLQRSSIFDETFKAEAKSDEFIRRYETITNKDTLAEAAKLLDEGGEEFVNTWFNKKAIRMSPVDTAVGFILLSRYQDIGKYDSAMAVAEKLREIGTVTGQNLQLFSITSRFDANMMQQWAQKELNKAFDEAVKGKTQKWIDKNKTKFDLTDEDIDYIRTRTLQAAQLPNGSRDQAIRLAEISSRLQDKIPPNPGQSFKAWQRISMLLNPKTQIRNVLGNGVMVPAFVVSDWFGSAVDKAISKKTGVRTTGVSGIKATGENLKAVKKGMYESYDDFKRHINTKIDLFDRFSVGEGKSFNENKWGAIAKALNSMDRLTSFLLDFGDRPFYEAWFTNSLNNQMRLNNVTEPTLEMVEIAQQEALQRTWQDNNGMTQAVASIKKACNKLSLKKFGFDYGLGDVLVKFTKTPANLTKAIYDFSPAAAISIAAKGKELTAAISTGQATAKMQKDFVNAVGKAAAGTLLYALFGLLYAMGRISGRSDDDKDVSAFEKYVQGIPEYSIKMFGKWWSYDWSQPIGAVPAIVANFMESRQQGDDGIIKSVWEAIRAGGEVLFEQSFMKSFQILFTADSIVDGLIEAVVGEATVPIPTVLSQTANVFDPYRRSTYDSRSEERTILNKVKQKIPGLRNTLEPEIDILGRETPNSQKHWFNAFFNPANTYTDTSTAVTDHVYELYQSTGRASAIPAKAPYDVTIKGVKHTLSIEERNEYQRIMGETSAQIIGELINNDSYIALTDEQKLEVIKSVYTYAQGLAKSELGLAESYDVISEIKVDLTQDQYDAMSGEEIKAIADDYLLSSYYSLGGLDTTKKATWFVNKSLPTAVNAAIKAGDMRKAQELIKSVDKNVNSLGLPVKEAKEMIKKSKASIKSEITGYWKEKFIDAHKAGDNGEKIRIKQILVDTGLYGNSSDVRDLTNGWKKAYQEEQGK